MHLVVPCYRSTLRLARAQDARVATAMRDLSPAHATAAGKVLLAYRPQWRDAVLSAPLRAVANGTIVDPERLRRHLGRVQQHGYAIEDEELLPGVRAVGAPVRASEADEAIAALAVSSTSLSTAALQELGPMLVSGAQQLGEAVGAEQ